LNGAAVRKNELTDRCQRHSRVMMRRLDDGGDAGFEDFQTRAESKRIE
jgi:hypothetical protein